MKWLKNLLTDARRYRWLERHVQDWEQGKLKLCITITNPNGRTWREQLDAAIRTNPDSPDEKKEKGNAVL